MEEETIQIEYDKLQSIIPEDIYEGKLNVMCSFQPKAYNPEKYKPEEKIKIKNEKDEEELKQIPIKNYIRWRVNGKDIQSNAKIVEWSDGSRQLLIGDEYFDLMFSTMDNVRFGLKDDDNISIINKPIIKRMLLTQSEKDITKEELDKGDANKVKLSYSYYDKKTYKKEDFASRYPRRKQVNETNLNKKRKREPSE